MAGKSFWRRIFEHNMKVDLQNISFILVTLMCCFSQLCESMYKMGDVIRALKIVFGRRQLVHSFLCFRKWPNNFGLEKICYNKISTPNFTERGRNVCWYFMCKLRCKLRGFFNFVYILLAI